MVSATSEFGRVDFFGRFFDCFPPSLTPSLTNTIDHSVTLGFGDSFVSALMTGSTKLFSLELENFRGFFCHLLFFRNSVCFVSYLILVRRLACEAQPVRFSTCLSVRVSVCLFFFLLSFSLLQGSSSYSNLCDAALELLLLLLLLPPSKLLLHPIAGLP